MRNRIRHVTQALGAAAVLAALALLAACATPTAAPPAAQMTDARALGASGAGTEWPDTRWWARYGDAELDRLIERALQSQPSLQVVQTRLRVAEAAVRASDAARGPQAQVTGDLTYQRFSENGLVPPTLGGETRWVGNLHLGAGWELDLFGRQRAALDSAVGQLRAAQADAQAA